MSKLRISETLSLPPDVTTQALAWLGRRGSGKSYGATKLAELLHDTNAQFVGFDPVGIWYGLRLAANGKDKGLDIPIFGGLHGDMPLEASAGALIADVIVSRNISAVVDVSQFESDADKARFSHTFAERFFFLKKSSPSAVHIFVEEAQEFIPQNIQKGEEKMLHAWQRMIRLGRNYGIGVSMISQRPQDVNKKALNQAECILCFQLTGPQERKAVEGWISEHGLHEDLQTVLPRLQQGHAHVWSPVWLDFNSEVRIAEKRTFAAGTTPKVGAKPVKTVPLEPMELEQVRKDMTATIERQKENDPAELKRKIAELKRELAKKASVPTGKVERIDREELAKVLHQEVDQIVRNQIRPQMRKGIGGNLESLVAKLESAIDVIKQNVAILDEGDHWNLMTLSRQAMKSLPRVITTEPAKAQARVPVPHSSARPIHTRVAQPASAVRKAESNGNLPKGELKVLCAVAQYPEGSDRNQLTVLTGFKRSTRDKYLQLLQQKGYVEVSGNGSILATNEGFGALGDKYQPPPTGEELQSYWLSRLPEGERRILEILVNAGGSPVTREQIDEQTGYSRSTRDKYLQLLQSRRLAESVGRGEVQATKNLFS